MITIGIDPGATGAIAALDGTMLLAVYDMPTVDIGVGKKTKLRVCEGSVAAVLRKIRDSAPGEALQVFLERVGAMPKQGVASMFAFGDAWGICKGTCAGLGLPLTLVLPAVWKRVMSCPANKDGARARAIQLYPNHAGLFARVKDDGRAEATLIGRYGALAQGGRT